MDTVRPRYPLCLDLRVHDVTPLPPLSSPSPPSPRRVSDKEAGSEVIPSRVTTTTTAEINLYTLN